MPDQARFELFDRLSHHASVLIEAAEHGEQAVWGDLEEMTDGLLDVLTVVGARGSLAWAAAEVTGS